MKVRKEKRNKRHSALLDVIENDKQEDEKHTMKRSSSMNMV